MKGVIIAGVNGGGTKTEAIVCNEEGEIIGRGISGPSNHHNIGIEAAAANISDALKKAGAQDPDSICIALAAIDTDRDSVLVNRRLSRDYNGLVLEHDAFAELYTERRGGKGILAIAGTGSIVFGYDGRERYRRCNSGWFLGDEGSGYAIGRSGISLASKMFFEGLERTAIAGEVLDALGLKEPDDLMEWAYSGSNTPSAVAGASKAVDRAASSGDKNATSILIGASAALASSSCELAERIGEDTVFINGGVFRSQIFRSNYEKLLNRNGIKCAGIKESAAVGALLIAADRKGVNVRL